MFCKSFFLYVCLSFSLICFHISYNLILLLKLQMLILITHHRLAGQDRWLWLENLKSNWCTSRLGYQCQCTILHRMPHLPQLQWHTHQRQLECVFCTTGIWRFVYMFVFLLYLCYVQS